MTCVTHTQNGANIPVHELEGGSKLLGSRVPGLLNVLQRVMSVLAERAFLTDVSASASVVTNSIMIAALLLFA